MTGVLRLAVLERCCCMPGSVESDLLCVCVCVRMCVHTCTRILQNTRSCLGFAADPLLRGLISAQKLVLCFFHLLLEALTSLSNSFHLLYPFFLKLALYIRTL